MPLVGWVDTDTVHEDWADAPDDVELLTSYLGAAYEQCVEYLPHRRDETTHALVPVVPDPLPARLPKAQIMQARAIYNSVTAGSGDQVGPDGVAVTVYPMDWNVRNLLRPRKVGRVL